MNPFMLSAPERLDAWIEFRDSLSKFDETEQLAKVASFWAQCPFARWYLDPDSPQDWPTAWEMLHDGEYCKNTIALGMEYTLILSGWDRNRVKLKMIRNSDDGEEFFVVIIDDSLVLNYSYGEVDTVTNLLQSTTIKLTYGNTGKTHKREMEELES